MVKMIDKFIINYIARDIHPRIDYVLKSKSVSSIPYDIGNICASVSNFIKDKVEKNNINYNLDLLLHKEKRYKCIEQAIDLFLKKISYVVAKEFIEKHFREVHVSKLNEMNEKAKKIASDKKYGNEVAKETLLVFCNTFYDMEFDLTNLEKEKILYSLYKTERFIDKLYINYLKQLHLTEIDDKKHNFNKLDKVNNMINSMESDLNNGKSRFFNVENDFQDKKVVDLEKEDLIIESSQYLSEIQIYTDKIKTPIEELIIKDKKEIVKDWITDDMVYCLSKPYEDINGRIDNIISIIRLSDFHLAKKIREDILNIYWVLGDESIYNRPSFIYDKEVLLKTLYKIKTIVYEYYYDLKRQEFENPTTFEQFKENEIGLEDTFEGFIENYEKAREVWEKEESQRRAIEEDRWRNRKNHGSYIGTYIRTYNPNPHCNTVWD